MDFISAVNTQDLITLLTAEDDMMLRSIVFTDPIAAIFHAPLAQHATRTDLIAPLPGGSRYRSTRRSCTVWSEDRCPCSWRAPSSRLAPEGLSPIPHGSSLALILNTPQTTTSEVQPRNRWRPHPIDPR